MAGEATIVISGNLGADAEFRVTPNGKQLTVMNVAVTPAKYSEGNWTDGETTWYKVLVWGKKASGVANSARKGMRVLVSGYLNPQTYTDKEGLERKSLEITANEIGIVPKILPEVAVGHTELRSDEEYLAPEEYPW